MIANGLSGFPPLEIKEELKNLYEDVNFMRHLSLKGMSLSDDQLFMTISGNCTKYGGALADVLMTRVDKMSTMIYRTVERLKGIPYRGKGGVSKEIKQGFGLYINAFFPSSFAISFQVGQPDPQTKLFPDFIKNKHIDSKIIIDVKL